MKLKSIYQRLGLAFFFLCCWSSQQAQTVSLVGLVVDGILKSPLPEAVISVYRADSSLVSDSVPVIAYADRNGKMLHARYKILVDVRNKTYLVRARMNGYEDTWQKVDIPEGTPKGGTVQVPRLEMQRTRQIDLDEVQVTATKIKMYYKGDTLVYNADAFKLPDGSMLEALIKQLPGVTMNRNGEIYVNGRKVEELLLGARTFFRGDKKVLLENLPHYTVKDVKVYEKQTDKSEALGHDVDPRRFVMDVNLRPEYRIGYIANMEAAGGTEDRYLGRFFLLGFTDRLNYALLGNLNNVSETRHAGQMGYWTPSSVPNQLTTIRRVGTDLYYQTKDGQLKEKFNADFASTSNRQDMRQRYEQFLAGYTPTSFWESTNRSGSQSWNLFNEFMVKKPFYVSIRTSFDYAKRDGSSRSSFEQWDDSLTATMRTVGMSEGRNINGKVELNIAFNLGKPKIQDNNKEPHDIFQRHLDFLVTALHSDDQSESSDYYQTRQFSQPAQDMRYNARNYRSQN